MALGVSAALVVTLAQGVEPVEAAAAPAAPAAAGAVSVRPERVSSRPDEVSAMVSARAQGARVEVESLREETSSTWANPDGTLSTELHLGPIRFKDRGSWRDVDLALGEVDGEVVPRGHAFGLRLAGATKGAAGGAKSAGETDLVSVTERGGAGRQVVLGWPGALGKPVLSGTRATYVEVQPGVDLVVESRRTGFEQLLVVKTPQALAALQAQAGDSGVSWQLPLRTKGLTARVEADGSVSFVDAKARSRPRSRRRWRGTRRSMRARATT
jgi:hypothetical protein